MKLSKSELNEARQVARAMNSTYQLVDEHCHKYAPQIQAIARLGFMLGKLGVKFDFDSDGKVYLEGISVKKSNAEKVIDFIQMSDGRISEADAKRIGVENLKTAIQDIRTRGYRAHKTETIEIDEKGKIHNIIEYIVEESQK